MSLSKWVIAALLILPSCSGEKEKSEEKGAETDSVSGLSVEQSTTPVEVVQLKGTYDELRAQLPPFDLNQELSNKSLAELRILRNTIPARYGFLFKKSDLRGYFAQTNWYTPLMEARWYGDCEESGLKKAPEIQPTPEELKFIDRVKALEDTKLKENYLSRGGQKMANVANLVNADPFRLPEEVMGKLNENGFAIVPATNEQFFHVYEQNDYSQTENFVTTDMYLQLSHIHFSFMLRKLEEQKFVTLLEEMLSSLNEAANSMSTSPDKMVAEAAAYNAAFYSIPLSILTEQDVIVPVEFKAMVTAELENVKALRDGQSSILEAYKSIHFPYSLFTPRGHYSRTDTLTRYFKAMQWLQLAPYCMTEEMDLRRAITAAWLLNTTKSKGSIPLVTLYKNILEPTTLLIGAPDNVSVMDVCNVLNAGQFQELSIALSPTGVGKITTALKEIAKSRNVIKPKVEMTCPDKINFMPARMVIDNQVLQEMVDIPPPGKTSARPFPRGLDVFAAFGNAKAEKVLTEFHDDQKAWSGFTPAMKKMKDKFAGFDDWDISVYNKWIKGLMTMLQRNKAYPYFMQTEAWDYKNLNTALASWAELKHDAILYAEQPMAAECGDGGDCAPPPDPVVLGYVEPNVGFWQEALTLIDLCEKMLSANGLLLPEIKYKSAGIRELSQFLLEASKKELRGETLSDQEFRTIEIIGAQIENLTLSVMETDHWSKVTGPDREVAVVADIYTNNVDPDRSGILHVAVGQVYDIYVVTEIEGLLYLTRGATFTYYELVKPPGVRLTDEEWQQSLKESGPPEPPGWMKKIIVVPKNRIQRPVATSTYSSGC